MQALHTWPLSQFDILTHSLVTWMWNCFAVLVPRVVETGQGSEWEGAAAGGASEEGLGSWLLKDQAALTSPDGADICHSHL